MTRDMDRRAFLGAGAGAGFYVVTSGKGFAADIHCPTGAPREAFVKITKAEPGGIGDEPLWRPVKLGIRPRTESEAMKKYLAGGLGKK